METSPVITYPIINKDTGVQSVAPYGLSTLTEQDLNIIENVINDSELRSKFEDAMLFCDQDSTREPMEDNSIRSGKTAFLPINEELVQLFVTIIGDYNNKHSGWNFDLEFIESIQLTHYHEGDHYDWHIDSFKNPSKTDDQNHLNKLYNRKVSATIWLNDPDEYEGGEFDLETLGPIAETRFETMKMPKGTIVVFPSYMWHRVRPVTSGVRKSLVLWIQGPPFK